MTIIPRSIIPTAGGSMMINPPFEPTDRYFGRREICLFTASTVKALFPLPTAPVSSRSYSSANSSTSHHHHHHRQQPYNFPATPTSSPPNRRSRKGKDREVEWELPVSIPMSRGGEDYVMVDREEEEEEDESAPDMGEWLAYVFYRTALPLPLIFHSLHLLRRLSTSYSLSPSSPSSTSPLVHHRLIYTSLILATSYSMDDSYSLKSWAVASKGLFDLQSTQKMVIEMGGDLGWRIGGEEERSWFGDRVRKGLVDIVEGYLEDWEMRLRGGRVEIEPVETVVPPTNSEGRDGMCGIGGKRKRQGSSKVGERIREGLRRMKSGEGVGMGVGVATR